MGCLTLAWLALVRLSASGCRVASDRLHLTCAGRKILFSSSRRISRLLCASARAFCARQADTAAANDRRGGAASLRTQRYLGGRAPGLFFGGGRQDVLAGAERLAERPRCVRRKVRQ